MHSVVMTWMTAGIPSSEPRPNPPKERWRHFIDDEEFKCMLQLYLVKSQQQQKQSMWMIRKSKSYIIITMNCDECLVCDMTCGQCGPLHFLLL